MWQLIRNRMGIYKTQQLNKIIKSYIFIIIIIVIIVIISVVEMPYVFLCLFNFRARLFKA